jgi:hypothetical protein
MVPSTTGTPTSPGRPDNRHSYLAVLPGASQEDRHAALDEMHPVDRTMRFLKDLVALQLSPPQFGLQSRQYRGRQTRQNAILSGSQLHCHARILLLRSHVARKCSISATPAAVQ